MIEQDYKTIAYSRLTDRHRNDGAFLAILDTLIELKEIRQREYLKIADEFLDIDKSTGKNLDLIGKLIGEERNLVNFIDRAYFGFMGARLSESYDIGYWYSLYKNKYGTLRTLTDEEYRRVLKARIVKNSSDNNRNSFIEVLNILSGNTNSSITESYDNTAISVNVEDIDGLVSYYLSKYKSDRNLIPVPLGRRLNVNHVETSQFFSAPYDLTVEFKMTNRLELNWKLDGFVEEQRYYCSETPIDIENLPLPKAIISGNVRTYTDTAIEVGKTYYVAVSSVKGDIEKVSDVISIGGDANIDDVVLLVFADNGYLNLINNAPIANNSNTVVTKEVANVLPQFNSESFLYVGNRRVLYADLAANLSSIFTVEVVGFPNFSNTLIWANWFSVGDTYCVRNNNLSQLTFGRTGKTPTFDSGSKAVTVRESIHACIMSDGININTFINGVLVRTYAYSAIITPSLFFSGDFSSYIEAVRVTNSVTRYSMSGFTPPVEKFPTQ